MTSPKTRDFVLPLVQPLWLKTRLKPALDQKQKLCDHARELSDIARPSAFWRTAPTLRFSCFAIFGAGVFWRASDFSTRTSSFDQNQRLLFCIINP